ncbi:3-deoxy-D-manno-octulosonic acid kinase [Granulosicoccus sp. 3-233]|uniref:3-deoxy-D-manno-octulosonic acid kinase n=1 Tax=Granulosicoccus sp. 3-233 TaxID=3417969 RepID=UPI003D356C1A
MSDSIVTEYPARFPGVVWRHCADSPLPFDPIVFDEVQLAQRQLLTGQAGAGRGNTFFFTLNDEPLVLRHYRRGGLAQKLSRQHYLYTGLERTRAMREFAVLVELCQLSLAVSRPHACRVVRRGAFYQASLVTHRIDGQTLAESLSGKAGHREPQALTWKNAGDVIARMHAAGVLHADLNAHNILFDDAARVSLIDFDRARHRPLPAGDPASGWCQANIDRLRRSILKVAADGVDSASGFAMLEQQWRETLRQSISPRS